MFCFALLENHFALVEVVARYGCQEGRRKSQARISIDGVQYSMRAWRRVMGCKSLRQTRYMKHKTGQLRCNPHK
jgi:hypothetical protein